MPAWLAYALGAVVCALLAMWLAPLAPTPVDTIAAIALWIGALLCIVLTVLALVRGGARM